MGGNKLNNMITNSHIAAGHNQATTSQYVPLPKRNQILRQPSQKFLMFHCKYLGCCNSRQKLYQDLVTQGVS